MVQQGFSERWVTNCCYGEHGVHTHGRQSHWEEGRQRGRKNLRLERLKMIFFFFALWIMCLCVWS